MLMVMAFVFPSNCHVLNRRRLNTDLLMGSSGQVPYLALLVCTAFASLILLSLS